MKRTRRGAIVAPVVALSLLLAACSGDEPTVEPAAPEAPAEDEVVDLAGTTVTVYGPEASEEEAGALQDALDVFAERNGMTITYTGNKEFETQIGVQAEGGNPPDIAIFPQPGKLLEFGVNGFVQPVPTEIVDTIRPQWPAGTLETVTLGGEVWGLQTKTDLKSLVWYNTEVFADGGYEIPTTWDGLKDLTTQMIADGVTPWCVGVESGVATGWAFTDWMEDLVLRLEDENVYDQWVTNEIKFADPRITGVADEILSLWNTPGAVYAAGGSIVSTPFGDNGKPLAEGRCAMHRQASFFAAFLPEGTEVGPDGGVNVFYFPAVDASRTPVLTAGTYLAAFRDAPEVWAVMEWLASGEGSTERQRAQAARKGGGSSGYLSANLEQDLSVYNDLERSFVEILQTAAPARFDASDLMPGAVGSGTFWSEGSSAINGDKTVADAFAAIDASWPAS
jgi:alpha-glucoside transport system substrate-binding protein